MDQDQLFRMQQEEYNRAIIQVAQVMDLTNTFLSKRVKASKAGMLTTAHRKKYQGQAGTVIGITEPDVAAGQIAGLHILWDDGEESKSLTYMVTLVR